MPSAPGKQPSPPEIDNIRERIKRRLEKHSGDNAAGFAATEDAIEEQIALLQKLPQATLHTGNIRQAPPSESMKHPVKPLTEYSLNLTESIHTAARELEKYGELLRRAKEDAQLTVEEKEALDRILLENENTLNNLQTEIAHLRVILQTEGHAEKTDSIIQRFAKWVIKLVGKR